MYRTVKYLLIVFTAATTFTVQADGQRLHLGLFADPLIGWYSSDDKQIESGGVKAGYAAGIAANWYFSQNYAFSTGITYLNTGGIQSTADTVSFLFANFTSEVLPGAKVSYKADYIIMPIGMRMRTNQIGYMSIFSDFGLDPGFLNKGRISIPSLGIKDESAGRELRKATLGFHIHAGAEYSLGGSTLVVFGIGYEGGLTDVTRDNAGQPADKTTNRLVRFRLGLYF
jgi:hypothetical protein